MVISQNNNTGIRSFRTLATLQDDIILTIIYYIDNTYTTKFCIIYLFIPKNKEQLKNDQQGVYTPKSKI